MIEALHHAKQVGCAEIAVLSDANEIFIKHLLNSKQVSHLFNNIITNPSYFDASGRLIVTRRVSADKPHNCTSGLCSF